PIGSRGISPVKKSQSTARLSANSAAAPAKTRRTRSGLPQIVRTIERRSTKSRMGLAGVEYEVSVRVEAGADLNALLTMAPFRPTLTSSVHCDLATCPQAPPFCGWVSQLAFGQAHVPLPRALALVQASRRICKVRPQRSDSLPPRR